MSTDLEKESSGAPMVEEHTAETHAEFERSDAALSGWRFWSTMAG
jgi:hypothetical protein